MSTPFKYLLLRIVIHKPSPNNTLEQDFAAKECANQEVFLMPHPPYSFGLAIFCHFVRWYPVLFPPHLQMNLEISSCIRWRLEEGSLTRLS